MGICDEPLLRGITTVANLVFLGLSVWLGIYIITRSPRSAVTWLAGLAGWSVAAFFFNFLLALSPPQAPRSLPIWLSPMLLFWPSGVFEGGTPAWLQGWLITPAIMLWHHATVEMRPGRMNAWRWTRVLVGYGISAAAIIGQRTSGAVFTSHGGSPLCLTFLAPGPLYWYYMLALLAFSSFCIWNLVRSAREAPTRMQKKQLNLMALATVLACSSGLVSSVSEMLRFLLPRVTLSILLGSAVVLLGYAVARYSALVEGRLAGRDFLYNGLAVGAVAALYLLVTWNFMLAYDVPTAAVSVVMILAIVTHSLIDIGRRVFDRFFYRRDSRELRERLRRLAARAPAREALEETLALSLQTLCRLVGATFAVLLLFREGELRLVASHGWRRAALSLQPGDLAADDVLPLPPGRFPSPLEESALLIPLFSGDQQQGALILGRPKNAESYTESDVERLLDPTDRIADVLRDAQREEEHLTRLAQVAQTPIVGPDLETELPTKVVEDALRNLFDYAYLADTPLGHSKRAESSGDAQGPTHLDRGKQVYQLMLEVMEKLRPPGDLPRDPIPRQWYPYLILHDAYLENKPNNEIMMRLYISEGTFNRTRRAAIRSMTRALLEMGMLTK